MTEYKGRGSDDGVILGRSSGKVGFYGTTPITQPTAQTALTTTPSNSALATRINSLETKLKNLGLISS